MTTLRKRVDGLEARMPSEPETLFIERIIVTPGAQAERVHSLWGDGVLVVRDSDENESQFRARFMEAHRPVAEARRTPNNSRQEEF